jgi:DNA-directed RNA polymerase beta' subunit
MSDQDTREIDSITFSLFSAEQILNMSVCKIDSSKLGFEKSIKTKESNDIVVRLKNSENRSGSSGTVYDPRMGTLENGVNCETCHQDVWKCPGHFGHIELTEPIIHPLYYKQVTSFLKCFCIKCFQLLISRDIVHLNGLNRYKGSKRFDMILEKLDKVDICYHCSHPQPEIKFSTNDSTISMVYKKKTKDKIIIVLTVEEIKKIFDNISNEDISTIGFDPTLVHPKNFIMTMFLVLPPCCRPYVITDGNMCDDDLTNQLIEIIKANNHLKSEDGVPIPEAKRQKYLHSLKFRILTFFNNSQGKAKHTTNGRPIKGLKERLGGKSGQIRNNLMGKRSTCPETPILMFETGNWKRAEHIVVGDIVVGDDGLPRTVINTVTGISPLYTIKQSYGDNYNVSCEHLLTLKYSEHCKIYWNNKSNKWCMKWYDRNSKTVKHIKIPIIKITKNKAFNQLKKIKNFLNQNPIIDIHIKDYLSLPYSVRKCMLGIKLNVPIQWKKKDVKIDPRILGLCLADNFLYKKQIKNLKTPIINYVKEWSQKYCIDFYTYITNNFQNKILQTNFLTSLKHFNLYNNYIPEEYIVNNEETRLLVLAGLIDMDGYVNHKDRIIYITQSIKNKIILNGALKIARSLGFYANINEKNTTFVDFNGIIINEKVFELTIFGEGIEKIPTLLPYKRCVKSIHKNIFSYNIEVTNAGIGRFCGFEVDQNNRFLLGDFTITHNCDQSGRTVIGPDPTLKMGQLGMPKEMAEILTVPVHVANYNIDILNKLVNNGKANFVLTNNGETRINLQSAINYRGTRLLHGDIIINQKGEESIVNNGKQQLKEGERVKRNGQFLEKIRYPCKKEYSLKIGDIVERHLQNGDIVLLNRQPTLHKGSMMAQKIIIMPHKTLRFNLSIAKSFNADFDGDEMNIHVPQTLEEQAELKMLSASKYNIISSQASKPNMCIVQDSLLGAYRMTFGNKMIRKDQFFNIAMKTEMNTKDIIDKIQHIRTILKQKGKKTQCFNGKGLISLILPDDLIYEKHNGANPEEPVVKIYRGVLYEGTLDKSIIGASHNSLIQIIYKEYGENAASSFIDNIQFVTNNWLIITSFSIGVEDCMVQGADKEIEISNVIQKCFIEAERIKNTTTHQGIRELRIIAALSKAKDIGLRIAKDALTPTNNFLSTVNSGSKGDFFNIAQITGLLGQQNLLGQRVNPTLSNGKRTLPHYPCGELPVELEYESRGFISSSFIKGLNPKEFYFHAMSGREGICDTAMGTATSGYMQRRIVKLTEDIKSQYDGTVRDAIGKIYQLSYGENGLDPVNTVKVGNSQEPCDISRIVAKLNMKHELQLKKKK